MPHANDASAPATDTAALLAEWQKAGLKDDYIEEGDCIEDLFRIGDRLAAALRASELKCEATAQTLNGRAYFWRQQSFQRDEWLKACEAERDRALAALALAEWKLAVRDSAGPRPWKEWEYDDQARDEGFIPRPSPKEASE